LPTATELWLGVNLASLIKNVKGEKMAIIKAELSKDKESNQKI